MSEPFIGQITMFGGNFAPRDWAFCDGQLLAISQNSALFSLLGTNFGGDGRTTFGLPDLRGRFPMHAGSGPGLTPRPLGSKGGAESVQLNVNHLPAHNHGVSVPASSQEGQSASPDGLYPAAGEEPTKPYAPSAQTDTSLGALSQNDVGLNQPHDNMPPYQCVSFIIALVGIYPSRS